MSASPSANLDSLEQKLEANPASKIFLPLAEQHRLQGNLDRAAKILKAGLEHNTSYTAARVALSRVLLERGEVKQGRMLLTVLLEEVPDNLLAQKLLADAGGPLHEAATDSATAAAGEETTGAGEAADDSAGQAALDVAGDDAGETGFPAIANPDEIEELSTAGFADEPAAADHESEHEPNDEREEVGSTGAEDAAWQLDAGDIPLEKAIGVAADEVPPEEDMAAGECSEAYDMAVPEAEEFSFDVSEALSPGDEEVGVDTAGEQDTQVQEDLQNASAAIPDDDDPLEVPGVEDSSPVDELAAAAGAGAGAGEAVWADPHVELPEPPSPEPGLWKADDESGSTAPEEETPDSAAPVTDAWDAPDTEFVVSPPAAEPEETPEEHTEIAASDVSGDSGDRPGPQPFDTIRLSREDLLPPALEAPVAEPAATELPDAGPVEESGPVPSQETLAAAEAEVPAGDTAETPSPVSTGGESVVTDTEFPAPTPAIHAAVSLEEEAAAERTLSLARLYRRQGRLDLASEVYRQVLDADPEDLAARRELEELCGQNVPEITDDDLVSHAAVFPGGVPVASTESLEDARQRKVNFLRAWLEHIREQD